MNSRRSVEVTYDRDADGRIIRAGASWGETRPRTEQFLTRVAMGSVFVSLFSFFAPQFIPLGLLGLVGSLGFLFFMPPPMRAVYFTHDGRMLTPHGIFYLPFSGQIGGHHDNIVSIEARMMRDQPNSDAPNWEKMFEVVIVSSGGDLVIVSRNTPEATALKAAVQLTNALQAIRKDRSRGMEYEGAWVTLN